MGFVTTHVLDTSNGKPASGLLIELWDRSSDTLRHISSDTTNSDGRLDKPIISEADMQSGTYELRFHVGDYFASNGIDLPSPRFLDIVPIIFGIADEEAHYHVPLLVSPYGYSTYRGS